ncbi:hypothetical protein Pcinc_019952 [Petrolisthes cinctipes]|uniref:Arginase n=1 Tax=Petrolisthes cinctipes TaxID=88211 RepID=A0AAE1FJ62_PETCI|nr:hypothetical protein Pcinc_019952 [Petrolisthes cinctipes]
MAVRVLCSRQALRLCSVLASPSTSSSSSSSLGLQQSNRGLRVGFLGAPFNKGQRRAGVSEGPQAVKDTGIITTLHDLGVDVRDYGDVELDNNNNNHNNNHSKQLTDDVSDSLYLGPNGERHFQTVLTYNQRLSSKVGEVLKDGRLCVTVGGDHSIAIGTIHGHAHSNPEHQVVVLWVDAHADLNTGTSSPSGNMHGMPAAFHITNLSSRHAKLQDGFPQASLATTHLAYIGLRDVDKGERAFLDQLGIVNYGMREVDRLGVREVVARCLDHLSPSNTRPLHVSFDIDALDPLEAPSTGTPVRGGLTMREGLVVVEEARAGGHMGALDLVEVNPHLGTPTDAAYTAHAAKEIIMGALVGGDSQ